MCVDIREQERERNGKRGRGRKKERQQNQIRGWGQIRDAGEIRAASDGGGKSVVLNGGRGQQVRWRRKMEERENRGRERIHK